MKERQMYTQEQLDIEIVKVNQSHMSDLLKTMDGRLDRMDRKIDWVIGIMVGGFTGLFGLMAHGFHWF